MLDLLNTLRHTVHGHLYCVTRELYRTVLVMTGIILLLPVISPSVQGQTEGTGTESSRSQTIPLEEVVVTGTRREERSVTEVSSPVDIIGVEELDRRGDTDMINLLRTSIPSFNADDNPLSGTPTSMRPVSLRGLSPDHVLVLVNGKRRHRGANIATFSAANTDGSQGVDISSIPSIALKQVQVLRDGAAAQYGSDAIAGVINFILNDDPYGFKIDTKFASTYEGDGDRYQIAGTVGFPLGDTGFLRLSGEFAEQDESIRAIQRPDAAALQAGANPLVDPSAVPDPATNFGIPDIKDNLKLFANMAAPINDQTEFYAFGNFAQRMVENDFFYRNPTDREGVFTDGSGNFLIGDMTPDDGVNCEGGVDFGGTGMVNNPIAVGAPDQVARMNAVFADPDCFSFIEIFPGGYSPRFGSDVTDSAGTMGIRGELDNGFTYDISASVGRSTIEFFANNVPNPSMGSQTPTNFGRIGDRVQLEKMFNLDVTYDLDNDMFASPLFIAAGVEWQDEDFEIKTGQPASFQAGVLANQGFLIGEEAIPGFSPAISGRFSRQKRAAYVDLEADVAERLTLGVATRYEEFSDATDSETTFKFSGMYQITESLALRSTISTGFHAPSLGQTRFSTTTTEFDDEGNLVESGQIPPTSPTALAAGGQPLDSETSDNFTFGIVFSNHLLTLTLDAYRIDVDDRLTLSASQQLTDQQIQDLIDEGFQAAAGFGSFRFFTNDFDSETEGLDLVLSMPFDFLGGQSEINAAINYTKTDVTSFDPSDPNELLDEVRVTQLEENFPEWRGNVTFTHAIGKWRSLARLNYFGDYTEMHVNGNLPIDADEQVTVDLEVGYDVTDRLQIIAGVENAFGEEPTDNPWDFIVGSEFPTTSPSGLDNGLWYLRLNYRR